MKVTTPPVITVEEVPIDDLRPDPAWRSPSAKLGHCIGSSKWTTEVALAPLEAVGSRRSKELGHAKDTFDSRG